MIVLEVLGEPEAQARPRVFRVRDGVRAVSPKTRWYYQVMLAAEQAIENGTSPIRDAVHIRLEFRMPRIKSLPKRREIPHTKKPDWDNLAKAFVDALVPVLLVSDSLVTQAIVRKRYALPEETPGCRAVLNPEGGKP